MKLDFKRTYVWLLLFFWSHAYTQNNKSFIEITSKQTSYVIGNKIAYLQDKSNRLSLGEVIQLSDKFIPSTSQKLNLGFSPSTYWVRFRIRNKGETGKAYWLANLNYPLLDYVTFYYRNKAGEWQKMLNGDNYPIDRRKPQTRTLVFPLRYLPTNQIQTYYLQIKTSGSFQIPLLLQTNENFYQGEVLTEVYYGILAGILLLLIVNNVFWGIAFRHQMYFWYILHVIGALFGFTTLSGHAFYYVWGKLAGFNEPAMIIFNGFILIGLPLFTRSFLDVTRPWIKLLLYFFVCAGVLCCLLAFMANYGFMMQLIILLQSLLILTLLMVSILSWVDKKMSAGLMVLSYLIFLIGGFSVFARYIGWLPTIFLTVHGSEVATLIEIVITSMALSDRYRRVQRQDRKEKELAQQEALRIEREAKENLEQKVQERTLELRHKNEKIEAQRNQLSSSLKNMQLLSNAGKDIYQSLSMDEIITNIFEHIRDLVRVDVFFVGIFNEQSQELEFSGRRSDGTYLTPFSHTLDREELMGVWTYKCQRSLLIHDFQEQYSEIIPDASPSWIEDSPKSAVYFPLWVRNKVTGVFAIHSYEPQSYNAYSFNILSNLTNYISSAFENAKAYEKINQAKEAIVTQNAYITEGINNARRIQNAILPNIEQIKKSFPEFFVLYKPVDIVSGDFYWYGEVGHQVIIAAVDCTGHGVSAAFMSMVGHSLLNQIVYIENISDPAAILLALHRGVLKTFRQKENESNKGMEMVICVIDKKQKILIYAGACNPIVYIQHKKLYQVKGDKMAIGGEQTQKVFTRHVINLDIPICLYMFSDGYRDQFGGPRGKKFMSTQFKNLLFEHHDKPMEKQKIILEETLDAWMSEPMQDTKTAERQVKKEQQVGKTKKHEQIDDILVMGMYINL